MRNLALLFVVMCPAFLFGQAWSGILDPARAVDWTNAGYPGGIPSRTTICANVLVGDTTAQIQTKVTNCTQDQVVKFPAGTWTLTAPISSTKGIVLRGAGPTQTFINAATGHSAVTMGTNASDGLGGYPSNLGSTNWTAGYTRGATVLTLTSTSALSAGQRIVLDQHNAAYVFTTGVEGTCISGNSCGRNDSPLQFNGASTRAEQEMVEIQSVDSSTQITIKAPGISHDYSSGLTPQAFYWNSGTGNIKYAGVEDMTVNANSNDFAVSLPFCDYCWVKNVVVKNIARAGVFFWWGYRDELRDSYISASNTAGAPTQYGAEINTTTFTKVENNIFYGVTSPILPEATYGLVASYNYALNTAVDNEFFDISSHLAHAHHMLYEGNVLNISYDNSWGSASHSTAFRNRSSGKQPNKTNYREPFKIGAQSHYMNVVGNVLGDTTLHTRYRCDNVDTTTSDNFVYGLGFWNDCINGIDGTNPYDTTVASSLMRWGNWDVVTYAGASNTNGVRYCTGSGTGSSGVNASNSACTANERASSDPTYPGLAAPSTTLPSSFYLSSKPSWFGSVAWPPIGPDVTGGNITNTGGHANKIPAQLCYENTAKDGSGFLTGFDASVCYAAAATYPHTHGGGRTVGGGHSVN